MATIQDIADYVGLSIATVSRALNKPAMVNAETRERVMQAAKKLNYFDPAKTRQANLKNKKISLGVIIPYITSFFFGELFSGISRVAQENHIDLILYELKSSKMNEEGLAEAFSFVQRHLVDGIILTSFHLPAKYDELIDTLQIPVVLLLDSHESGKLPTYKVDDIRASFEAVSYLVSRGHRNIGMISALLTDQHDRGEQLRLKGYKQAVDFYGLPFSEALVAYGDMRFEDGYTAMKELLGNREETGLTAVFAASDEMAIGAMRCIFDAGLKVPEDISVIGFDNLSVSRITMPKLTTIEQPFGEIGAEGVKHMIRWFTEGGQIPEKGQFYLPYKIIERESVAEIHPGEART
ncbi:LacI family DNA-binding transcriptional regulator [Paenibacillus apii]|uniref:LacI family DNA-binding transcriptional regulator n=1 Tax=Paenibacillus apii TaxID=1850370 RepID=UPI00143B4F5D|nr:LacI family DNA-binding transcriptional regulator [Paenibacillus apii]NJJ41946.1 LacI family transcriptional regulator [Paenibacillus apii]